LPPRDFDLRKHLIGNLGALFVRPHFTNTFVRSLRFVEKCSDETLSLEFYSTSIQIAVFVPLPDKTRVFEFGHIGHSVVDSVCVAHHGTTKQVNATVNETPSRSNAMVQLGFAYSNPLPNRADIPPAPTEIIALVFLSYDRWYSVVLALHFKVLAFLIWG